MAPSGVEDPYSPASSSGTKLTEPRTPTVGTNDASAPKLYAYPNATEPTSKIRSADSFASGSSSALNVLDGLRVLLDLRVEHNRARSHLAAAIADLERASGLDLEELEERHEQR